MTKRILYLTPTALEFGGVGRYCRYQISALREIYGSAAIRAMSLVGHNGPGTYVDFPLTWHGRGAKPNLRDRVEFTACAVAQAVLWRPDVIHCAHVNFTPLVSRLKVLCGATTVLNVYGLELWSELTKSRHTHMACMDHIIADCYATADHVTAEAMHPDVPVVIWDCADLDRFRPGPVAPHLAERYSLPDMGRYHVAMTLGRLSENARHKGYDRLLEIWAAVRARVADAQLVIAGRGDDTARLQAKTRELGLSNSVTFTGPIDEEDIAAIYRAAHVFVLVSDKGPGRGEGIPLTPLEAMASGLPVLVGDEDGSREAVDGTRNGIVVSPRDLEAMTKALVTLLSETGTARDTRVAEARAVAEERFGYSAFRDKHAAFYAAITAPTSSAN